MEPIRNKNSKVYLDENGVFIVEWGNNITLEKEDLETVVKIYDEMAKGALWKVLHFFPRGTTVSAEGRHYAENRENPAGAEAFIIRSLGQRILFNFYRRFRRMSYPMKEFSNKDDAMKWLDKVERD